MNWLQTVERVFDVKDILDEKKVKLVALKLRRYASTWWANIVAKRAKKGKRKIKSWRKMKSKLKEKFLPSLYLQENYSKLHHLKQGSLSIQEYTRKFKRLLIKCDLKEDEDQTLARYLGGLNERIAHVMEVHPYHTLDELSSLARKVEIQRRVRVKLSPLSHPFGHTLHKGLPTSTLSQIAPQMQNHLHPQLTKQPLKLALTPHQMPLNDVLGAKALDILHLNVPTKEWSL